MKAALCLRTLPVLAFALFLAGCFQKESRQEDMRERAADATAAIKRDSKAIVQGIREGWNRDKPLDLNTATREQLADLPGITLARADRIIANRPYEQPRELVSKRVLTQKEFDALAERVKAKK